MFHRIEYLFINHEDKVKRCVVYKGFLYHLPYRKNMINGAITCSKARLFFWLVFVKLLAYPGCNYPGKHLIYLAKERNQAVVSQFRFWITIAETTICILAISTKNVKFYTSVQIMW